MKFQYCSDLHLEKIVKKYRGILPRILPRAPVLLLAGDIGYPKSKIYFDFLHQCSRDFKWTLFVDGNHEHDHPFDRFQRSRDLYLNVIHLQNSSFDLDFEDGNSARCYGTTLWTPTVRRDENRKGVKFLESELQSTLPKLASGKKRFRVVVTHHLPSFQLILPKYEKYSNLNRFANDLDYLMLERTSAPNLWVCGHSHCTMEKQIGFTKCCINTDHLNSSTTKLNDF